MSNVAKSTPSLAALRDIPEEAVWLANFPSASSRDTYQQAVQSFMNFFGITTPHQLRSISHAHVITYREHLQREKMKPRTVNNRLSALSSLFNHLIDKQVVAINPVQGVKRLAVDCDRVESKRLSDDEVQRMRRAPRTDTLQGLRDCAMLHIFFFTGCRVSEVARLLRGDYYEEQGYTILDFWVKGGKRNRVPTHPELQAALRRYLGALHETHAPIDNPLAPLLLPVRHNHLSRDPLRQLNRSTIDHLWQKYAGIAGVEGSTPHSARTTFISNALEHGAPIESVQYTVHHSRIDTTRMYDKRKRRYAESAAFKVWY